MLARFCKLCAKTADTSLIHLQRRYARPANKTVRKIKQPEEPPLPKDLIPIITCKRRAFNFYEGQTYPKGQEIPLNSNGWHHHKSKGDHFFIHPRHTEDKKSTNERSETQSFEDYNFLPGVCDKLEELNALKPLEIQKLGIPNIMNGCNTLLAAETGCGKTIAYLLPLINQVLEWKSLGGRGMNTPLALIITPTRELAVQIGIVTKKLSKHLNIRTEIITGGKTKRIMMDPPLTHVDILVGSFGVISKLTTTRVYSLEYVRHLVLDEADALFHETFEDKLIVFLRKIPIAFMQSHDENGFPKAAQLTMSSATMPKRMSNILNEFVNVDSLQICTTVMLHKIKVLQKFVRVSTIQKPEELLKYVKPKVARKEQIIIFSNNNSTCDWVSMFLNENGIKAVSLNGTMPLSFRQGKYAEFRSARALVLSATNAGSRGLDTLTVNHILNYEFPLDTADYIHRCGRTGREGTSGECKVTNFISTQVEVKVVRIIERAVRRNRPMPIINVQCEPEPMERMEDPEPNYVDHVVNNIDDENSIPY